MLTSVVTFYDNEMGPSSTASLLFPPLCRCVQHRHPEQPTGVEGSVSSLCSTPSTLSPSNRESGIRNPNNRCISNHFQFSNRKYSAISCPEARRVRPTFQRNATQPDSNRDTAIKNPDKPPHFNHFQFSNRDKMGVLRPNHISGNASFGPSLPPDRSSLVTHPLSLGLPPCLRASVANLCDNGWLKLRLM